MEISQASWLPVVAFSVAYAIVLGVDWALSAREYRTSPEKAARYRVLPLRYKLACRLIVAPLLAGTVLHAGWAFAGLVGVFLLQNACVRWYQKAGLL